MTISVYGPEEEAFIVNSYRDGMSIQDIALKCDRSTRAITAKLVALGEYVAIKAMLTPSITREQMVNTIALELDLDASALGSITKANKSDISRLLQAVRQLRAKNDELSAALLCGD